MTPDEEWNRTLFGTFQEAKFALERKLAEIGVPLDLSRLKIGPAADDNFATMIHPTKQEGRFVVSRFMLPSAVPPWDFDTAAYFRQFESKSVAAH